ncbi:hypothetical protein GUITHDRAFT_138899 [Guillardia theta CCMP2712]|uniref:SET domain-containing protein n=1 Tax=Guillardia theta (strain CCMP2712) TaxID=905079 RepID=L1JAZ0_GUITC|nr:hypothetical protein GUITHDRAFT_138899 [Guillardia theta CCMP2712]EKX45696.1 hypothetical protein GUITHDRAFT_138899 [Guillardia theta CCMP2712]|eukprot:XP_005832676.1 hypothetical protein GUITHDRAFT_138899 [Guillardia theta CCMP2712]
MRWQCFDGSLTAASSLTGLALVLLLETRPHGRVTLTEGKSTRSCELFLYPFLSFLLSSPSPSPSHHCCVIFIFLPLAITCALSPAVDALVVKPSTIPQAGLGLFAAVDIPAGTEIGRYAGSLWPQGLWLRWKGAKLGDVLSTAPSSEPLVRLHFMLSDGTLLDHVPYILPWVKVSTKLSRMNEPSLGRDVNVVTEEDGDSLVMKAEFDIGPTPSHLLERS